MTVFSFQSGWTSCSVARTFSVDLFPPNCIQLWILWTFDLLKFSSSELSGVHRYYVVPISTLMCGWTSCFYLLTVVYLRQNQLEYASFPLDHLQSVAYRVTLTREASGKCMAASGLFCMSAKTDSHFHQECTRPQQALRLSLPACLLVSSQTVLQNMCWCFFTSTNATENGCSFLCVPCKPIQRRVCRSTKVALIKHFMEQRRSIAFFVDRLERHPSIN